MHVFSFIFSIFVIDLIVIPCLSREYSDHFGLKSHAKSNHYKSH